ncbi:MAG TPA: type III secretion system translocon subunit SctB [Bordetella sp.]|uniref:type III secretion system translocon subunit SctB n=1 Tax=Bordetella sp. TaxID=28081 RepID=UPI002ED007B3
MTGITSLPPNLQTLLAEASQPGADLGQIKGKLLREINALPPEQVGSILKFIATQGEGQDQKMLEVPGSNGRKDAGGANEVMKNLNAQTVSTDIYSVMALIQKLAQEQRNTARTLRDSNMEQQVTQLKSAADEIRNAAQDRFVGAVVQSAMQIGSGVASIGAGVASAVQAGKAASMDDSGLKQQEQKIESMKDQSKDFANKSTKELESLAKNPFVEPEELSRQAALDKGKLDQMDKDILVLQKKTAGDQKTFDMAQGNLLKSADRASQFGQGASGVLNGIGGMVHASQERAAALHDAQKSERETEAKVFETRSQQANDFMQQMMDVIRDVRDKLSAIEQSNVETNRGIARNI